MKSDESMPTLLQEEVERLRTRVLELERREQEREYMEAALNEGLRLAALTRQVTEALIQEGTLQESLQQCAHALVTHLGAAFARVWTLNAQTQILELQASAGMYTHLNGAHSRIRVGDFKIGRIAAQKQPHLTNQVLEDPEISDQQWAAREGMVSFAGYPLLIEGELVGVMALFARVPLSPAVLGAMASVSNAMAVSIQRKHIEEERIHAFELLQQAALQAEASRARLVHILDNLPDGFMMFDEQWRYSYINAQAQPFTGKPWQGLLGKKVWDEFPELIGSLYYQQYHHAIRHQEAVAFEIFAPTLSGWFDIHAYPIPDGLAVYFRNITTRKQVEEARARLLEAERQAHVDAEAAKERISTILESITDAFFALDSEWRFTYLNAQGELLLQRTKEELLGKRVWDEFPEAVGTSFDQQYHRAVERRTSVSFEEFYPPLGTWFEVRAYPTPDGLSIYYHDITERKQAEDERLRLFTIAEQARHEAEAALQLRNDFLSSVSHDLKTPIAVMRGNVQLLQRRIKREGLSDPTWAADRLSVIEAATIKMNGMVEELLDVAKLQAGQQLDLDMRPISLISLIQQINVEQQETTRRHQIVVIAPTEEILVRGDRIRLDRVLANLLSNAIKYSPAGGRILVEVTQEEVQDRRWVVVSIHDQGIGIPLADQAHIFDTFYRASNVLERMQGTGVGLASTAQIIAQHGGSISVKSEEGQGSTFTIRLPLLSDETMAQSGNVLHEAYTKE